MCHWKNANEDFTENVAIVVFYTPFFIQNPHWIKPSTHALRFFHDNDESGFHVIENEYLVRGKIENENQT